MNVAPEGNPVADSDAIASPSGSAAVTVNDSSAFSATLCAAGADTTGARSTFVTPIVVLDPPDSALRAVNVTV